MNVPRRSTSARRRRCVPQIGAAAAGVAATTAAIAAIGSIPTVVGLISFNHNETVLYPNDSRPRHR